MTEQEKDNIRAIGLLNFFDTLREKVNGYATNATTFNRGLKNEIREVKRQLETSSEFKIVWNRSEVEILIRLAMQSKGFTPEYEVNEFIKDYLK